jgi:hypothetical protein
MTSSDHASKRRTQPRHTREHDLAEELATLTTRLRVASAAHQRLREGIRCEAQALVANRVLCRGGTNAALARLRLPPVDEDEPTDALTFEVTVALQVPAHDTTQAYARALRIVMHAQTHLRDATADDDPTICVLGAAATSACGQTTFAVEADLHLTLYLECTDGPVPWATARRRLEVDLARLDRVEPDLDTITLVDARRVGPPDPDGDDPDKYDPDDAWD